MASMLESTKINVERIPIVSRKLKNGTGSTILPPFSSKSLSLFVRHLIKGCRNCQDKCIIPARSNLCSIVSHIRNHFFEISATFFLPASILYSWFRILLWTFISDPFETSTFHRSRRGVIRAFLIVATVSPSAF